MPPKSGVPPYWSMKEGINVHLVEDGGRGLQMRRMLREEIDTCTGGNRLDTSMSGGGLLCFHVRLPPKARSKEGRELYMDLGSWDEKEDTLELEDMQEVRVRVPMGREGRPCRESELGHMGLSRRERKGSPFTLWVHSFVQAPNRRHGVAWVSLSL